MKKIKKAVASLAALAAISALGISASAATTPPRYNFSLTYNQGIFSDPAEKNDSLNYAGVHTDGGTVSASKPVYFTIYSAAINNNKYRVSGTRTYTSNSQDSTITYTDSVYEKQNYFLRGEAGAYSVTAQGYWNP